MRKTLVLVCALFISFALLFLPSIEARALHTGPGQKPARCGRSRGRYTPCIPRPKPKKCGIYERCPPRASPPEP
ncbi:hypothetical protein ACJRO7_035639 [Eucalyptus globulus]|uniref:Uncharacterized protein n=1 Tax=Eucalyptus globulus TaxID=34317 RepID=A0ABD3JAX5_EUCGL